MYSIVFDNAEYTNLPHSRTFSDHYSAVKYAIRNVNNKTWHRASIKRAITDFCAETVTTITPGCKASFWYI